MESQPVKPVEPQQTPVVVKEKTRSRPAVVILSVLLLLALAGSAALGYATYNQNQTANSANAEIERLFKENTELRNGQGIALADDQIGGIASYNSFLNEYNNIMAASVSYDKAVETKAIEAALKDYYKLSPLPEGWDVLSVYKVVKPETPPPSTLRAIVYWPATEQKQAGFIPLIKEQGGSWKYEDML